MLLKSACFSSQIFILSIKLRLLVICYLQSRKIVFSSPTPRFRSLDWVPFRQENEKKCIALEKVGPPPPRKCWTPSETLKK